MCRHRRLRFGCKGCRIKAKKPPLCKCGHSVLAHLKTGTTACQAHTRLVTVEKHGQKHVVERREACDCEKYWPC